MKSHKDILESLIDGYIVRNKYSNESYKLVNGELFRKTKEQDKFYKAFILTLNQPEDFVNDGYSEEFLYQELKEMEQTQLNWV